MHFTLKKKLVAGAAVAALALGAGGAAFAYWTASGSGSGTATVASSNGALTLHASFPSTLYPGDSETVSFTADNAGAQAVAVGTVHSVVGVDSTHATAGCLAADFSVADVVENQSIAAAAVATALTHDGTISMSNTNVSQDACKGATLTLTLSS
jgi:hypothetical protein